MSGHHHHGHGHGHSHDHGGTGRAVGVTLTVNLVVTAAKWLAFFITRSPSLFGEAAHSTADSLNPLVLWYGARRGRRPADKQHPLGHGREAYFWSLIAAQLMLLVGAVLTAKHGIETILSGHVPTMSPLALGIMALAAVGETYSLVVVLRQINDGSQRAAHKNKNPILLALAIENSADILGVLLALAGYGLYMLTGNAMWDAGFSLAIAALLACTSIFLIRRNRSLIVGEVAGEEVEAAVRAAAEERQFATLESVTAVMRGPNDVECHLDMRWNKSWFAAQAPYGEPPGVAAALALSAASREVAALKTEIKKRATNVTRITVEIT